MKHVALIRPPIVSSINSFSAPVTPPLALAYLESCLENNGFKVSLVDAVGEAINKVSIIEDPKCRIRGLNINESIERIPRDVELIGISCMFTQEWLFIKKFIEAVSEVFSNIPIVLGGEHVTAMPEYILNTCPSVTVCALGEGEETIVDLAKNFPDKIDEIKGIVYRNKEGNPIRTEPRKRIKNIEEIPRPNWSKLPIFSYLDSQFGHGLNAGRTMPILATRGCPFQCTFCSNKEMYDLKYYMRSPRDVVEEIEDYIRKYEINNVDFYDLTAIVKKNWIMEFAKILKEKELAISWSLPSGTRSEALDDEVTQIMGETNCKYLVYAAESGSEKIQRYIKKEVKLDRMIASMKAAKQNGLTLRCNLMLGFPKENRLDVFKTLKFQIKLAFIGVDDVPLYMFSAYPGTELFDYLIETKKIPSINEDYFKSLLCQMDLTESSNYCENIGERELAFYRFVGMSLFYSLSYILFPKRIFRSLKNIFFTKKTDTVFEQRLMEFIITKKSMTLKNATTE